MVSGGGQANAEGHIYNSAGRLLSYPLDTFPMNPGTNFVHFHHRLTSLPLIDYLTYRPKLFYRLPSFTVQVSNQHSACTLIFAEKGLPFRTDWTTSEVEEVEAQAGSYHKMPKEI